MAAHIGNHFPTEALAGGFKNETVKIVVIFDELPVGLPAQGLFLELYKTFQFPDMVLIAVPGKGVRLT
jgi:hypothetical protein